MMGYLLHHGLFLAMMSIIFTCPVLYSYVSRNVYIICFYGIVNSYGLYGFNIYIIQLFPNLFLNLRSL